MIDNLRFDIYYVNYLEFILNIIRFPKTELDYVNPIVIDFETNVVVILI